MNSRPNTDEAAGRKPLPPIVLHGHWLFFARAACVALSALTVGLFFASIFPAYEQLSTVCEGNAGCVYPRLFPEDSKALEGLGGSGFYAVYHLALALALALGFWVIGAILFWKSSGQLMALYASIALVTFGTVQADTIHWLADAHPRLDLLVDLVYFVGAASFFVLFCMFPDGRLVPRWTRWAAVASITYWLLVSFFPESSPISPRSWPLVINASLFLCLIGSLVVAQIYRYRQVSGPVERQQTKWVVFGFTVYIVLFVVVQFLIGGIFARTQPGIPQVFYDLVSTTVIILSTLLIPLSIGFAVQRHHLWDIDRIIKLSLVYSLLSAVLTIVFELANQLLLPFIFQFIPTLDDSSSIQKAASVVIAVAVLKPSYTWINKGVSKLLGDGIAGRRDEDIIGDQRVEAERKLAEQRAQDEALQDYLDQMGSLLLEKDLRESEEDSEVRTLARARTLTVLGRLDPSRKTAVMQFLVEAELVQSVVGTGPIISLGRADLSGADLSDANVSGADLSRADLSDANLRDANLRKADLREADLSGADLKGIKMWTEKQLTAARSLEGATMPDGQTLKSDVNPDGPTLKEWLKSKGREEDGENGSQS
jgi:hypothetical protein